jgi:hypothetical protein
VGGRPGTGLMRLTCHRPEVCVSVKRDLIHSQKRPRPGTGLLPAPDKTNATVLSPPLQWDGVLLFFCIFFSRLETQVPPSARLRPFFLLEYPAVTVFGSSSCTVNFLFVIFFFLSSTWL